MTKKHRYPRTIYVRDTGKIELDLEADEHVDRLSLDLGMDRGELIGIYTLREVVKAKTPVVLEKS